MSTPLPADGPHEITSIDCKILQYQYAITKIDLFVGSLKRLQEECTVKDDVSVDILPLMHYIVLFTTNFFAVNEPAFNSRLELLANFKLVKPMPITISPNVSHIPYDHPDNQVTALDDIPKPSIGIKCLKILENLCQLCSQGIQKRLTNAKAEQEKLVANSVIAPLSPNYYTTLTTLTSDLFNLADIDVSLTDMTFPIPRDDSLSHPDWVEASLVDMDVKVLFVITSRLQQTLNNLKPELIRFRNLKNTQKTSTVPNFNYSLHKIFLLTLRLNDLYTIIRKIGRKIYLSNLEHLYDQKFLFQSKNSMYFKTILLNNLDDIFNTTKKNGTLIANLTRFIRQNSRYDVNIRNVNDFNNFISQSFVTLETTLTKFEDFGFNWIACELRFRKVYLLPRKTLFEIYHSVQEEKPKEKDASKPKNEVVITIDTVEKELKKLDVNDPPVVRGSRSSSVSSISSNSSLTRPIVRRGSISSPIRNSVHGGPTQPFSPTQARPSSMIFLNSNASLTKLELLPSKKPSEAEDAVNVTPTGRRRSNSQPIKPTHDFNAASGAASAVQTSKNQAAFLRSPASSNRTPASPSLRSPSGSIKRSSSLTRKSVSASPNPPTPTALNKVQKQLIAVAEEENDVKSEPLKLSANQRLQQHLRQAAKSGSLMTQQKETFTSVTFDPNNPSAFSLRPPTEAPSSAIASESAAAAALNSKAAVPAPTPPAEAKPAPRVRSARDQVTRRNTQRNSAKISADMTSTESLTSPPSSDSSLASSNRANVKKVRFTGVPDYSETEDAPTKYANRILKNFAVFKPAKSSSQLQKLDRLLREESLSFKKQSHAPIENTLSPPPAQAAARSISTSPLSKIKKRLI